MISLIGILVAGPAWGMRVVSLNLCTDQLLLLLAPEDAAGVTFLAKDPRLSYVASLARGIPAVRADAEAVLALHPDLILAGRFGAAPTVAFLKTRVHVEQFSDPTNFAEIAANLDRLAALLGVPKKARALDAAMQAGLPPLPHASRGKAIVWQPAGYTAGPGTMEDAVLHAAGWQNAGNGGRLSLEALLKSRPDLVVTETSPAFPSLATDLLSNPALASVPVRHIPPPLLICPGPYTPQAVRILATP